VAICGITPKQNLMGTFVITNLERNLVRYAVWLWFYSNFNQKGGWQL